jgi:hypothetical protein
MDFRCVDLKTLVESFVKICVEINDKLIPLDDINFSTDQVRPENLGKPIKDDNDYIVRQNYRLEIAKALKVQIGYVDKFFMSEICFCIDMKTFNCSIYKIDPDQREWMIM